MCPARTVKRGVGPFVAQRDGLLPAAAMRPRDFPSWGNLRGALLFSACQHRQPVAPDVLQLPSLERPVLLRCGGADTVQLPAVRALAGLGHGLDLKVAVIADKHHFDPSPYIFH